MLFPGPSPLRASETPVYGEEQKAELCGIDPGGSDTRHSLLTEVKPEDRRNINVVCVLCKWLTCALAYRGDTELEDRIQRTQHELYLASHQRGSFLGIYQLVTLR